MKAIFKAAVIFGLALSATHVIAAKEAGTKDFSGWMDDYDSLVFHEDKNAFVFFNEDKRGKYDKVMIQSVELFFKDGESNGEISTKSADYLRDGAEKMLEERGLLATEAGPGVIRYQMAITGVTKTKEELKARNLIPVAAVFRGAQAATGNVATYIDVMFEGEMVDSVTGERAAAVVRKGIGATGKRSGDELTFEDVVPTLDFWLEAYGNTLDAFLAKRQEH